MSVSSEMSHRRINVPYDDFFRIQYEPKYECHECLKSEEKNMLIGYLKNSRLGLSGKYEVKGSSKV